MSIGTITQMDTSGYELLSILYTISALLPTMKVAIIGSGACGLVSIKSCIDEGLQPVCFEQEDTIGGLWHFTEEERHSSVYRSTVINTSKEMMCFSDFPIPKDFAPFMHHTKVMEYFHLYAKHFDLYKYIRYQTQVIDIRKASDYDKTGNWEVVYTSLVGPEAKVVKTEVYNAVMVCIGHHSSPYLPSFKGMEEFDGIKIHSHAYKDFKMFEGKRVLIVGIGNSGGDIAVELSRHASQVYLSTRKGSWVFSRLHDSGVPIDHWANRRILQCIPLFFLEYLLQSQVNKKFDHSSFALKPPHSPSQQHPFINDDLPNRIITGSIIVKPNIDHFTKSGTVFDDQTSVDDLDAVVFCTGYNVGFSFIDKSIIPVEDNDVSLYKYAFPPHLSKWTLAVIGCFQPLGAVNPVAELQSRWVTRVFKGILKLPSEGEMMQDINKKKEAMKKRYYTSRRHTIQVDYIPYSDELAELAGCKPSLLKLLLTDPVLALHCFTGPCTPPQYRLTGPGVWPGAREAIMNADKNVMYSTKTRVVKHDKNPDATLPLALVIMVFFVIVIAVLLRK